MSRRRSDSRAGGKGRPLLYVLAVLPSLAWAAEPEGRTELSGRPLTPSVEVDLTGTYSDNIRRTPDDKQSGTLLSLGALIDAARNGTRLDYDIAGDIQRIEYLDSDYKGRFSGYFDGLADFAIVQDRLKWTLRDSFTDVVADPLRAPTPDNVQNFNFLSTGPRLELRFGGSFQLTLRGTYSLITNHAPNDEDEREDFDSDRIGGELALTRILTPSSGLTLAGSTEDVDFDDAVNNSGYKRSQASLIYRARGFRTELWLEAGATRVRMDDDSSDGMMGRVEVRRRISQSSNVMLSFTRQTADAADIFRYSFDPQFPAAGPLRIASGDPFTDTTARANWLFARARTSFGVAVYRIKEEYEISSGLDRNVTGGDVRFERQLRPSLTLSVMARYENQDYSRVSAEEKQFDTSASLRWEAGNQLGLVLRCDRLKRTDSTHLSGYVENRVSLAFAYGLTHNAR